MIRAVIFFAFLGLLAFGAAWLAERPGEVAVTWQGWQIETSLLVAAGALLIATALLFGLWSLLRAVWRTPKTIAAARRNRRAARGYQALSKGLVAIAAGDAAAARRYTDEVRAIAPNEPLALLLTAQTAQLTGDRAGAEQTFRALAGRDDTKLLGLRGLYVEAQRRNDVTAARAYAEEAAKSAPALSWAGQAAMEFRCTSGDWSGALAMLDSHMNSGGLDKADYRRRRAVLLTARALAAEDNDRDLAKSDALEAVKLAPALVPAAALAGRLLAESGDLRRASRVVETAWRANPHPDLATTYAHLRYGDSTHDRLARVETLGRMALGHIETALAVARAAIDAHEFGRARAVLEPFLAAPTQRVAALMAELEQREHGDEGRAREWIARTVRAARDLAWTADGYVSDRWLPISPVSGRLDAFEWKVPLAELGHVGPVIEEELYQPPAIAAVLPPAAAPSTIVEEPLPTVDDAQVAETTSKAEEKAEPMPPPNGAGAPTGQTAPGNSGSMRRAEPVIPLVQAPDDPGPTAEAEADAAGPDARKGRRLYH